MALTVRKVKGRNADAVRRDIDALERELRGRLDDAHRALGLLDENARRISDLDELVRAVADAESTVEARAAAPAPELPSPPARQATPPAPRAEGEVRGETITAAKAADEGCTAHGATMMDDISHLEAIEKLAHDAGADTRAIRKSAEDLYDAVVKRYLGEGESPVRAHYLAVRDPIGQRAYAVADDMARREDTIREVIGRL